MVEEGRAYILMQIGRELLEQGDPAQAAVVLERASAEESRKGSILELLGRAYYACGRYQDAALRFEEALEVDPTNHYAHYCLGLCYLKTSKRAEAGGHFKMAWFMKPDETYRGNAERFGVSTGGKGVG